MRGKRYPPELLDFVKENAPGKTNVELLEMCRREFGEDVITLFSLAAYKKNHHISSGLTGWYRKGHAPANKGKKWDDFMSPEGQQRVREAGGIFEKGNVPHNTLPVGSVVVNKNGYLLKKVQEHGSQWVRWRFIHQLVWEEHYGPIPKGYAVLFADRDKRNCSIDNLVLVSNSQRAVIARMGLQYWDRESLEAAMQISDLKSAVVKKRRKKCKSQ